MANPNQRPPRCVGIAADFTVLPIAEPLEFWLAELGIAADVRLAPDHQLFQTLLADDGALGGNRDGVNVVLVARHRLAGGEGDPGAAADDLAAAVRASADRTAVGHLVVSCPAPPGDLDRATRLATAERRLVAALAADPRIRVVTEAELLDTYPVASPHDPYSDRAAQIPYTPAMFAALATMVARGIHAWLAPRPKVIAVDADNTLWDGVVGEDGVLGVTVGPGHRALQELLLAQRAAGRLLCVCSKNRDADVLAVLRDHPDMVLRPEHVTARRVNWLPKPENLAALAEELDLSLDSFVLLDDSPVERAAVRAACPEVLVPPLPADAAAVVPFLRHYWPLDHPHVTGDDRARAERYDQQRARQAARSRAPSLASFLDTLGLEVDVRPLQPADVARAAQLTHRVNQFNATTVRRSAAELTALPPHLECLVIDARDRFGDYGQVGVVVTGDGGDTLEVDTFLLSCRVLGRGVEHRVLAELGRHALDRGLSHVTVPYVPTARNQPALAFLRGLPAERRDDGAGARFVLTAQRAAAVTYQPRDDRPAPADGATPALPTAGADPDAGQQRVPARPADSDLAGRIATSLATAEQVLAAVARRRGPAATPAVATDDPTAATVARIWSELLEFPPASVTDDFFELGGHSLLVVQFAARVRDEFGVELPLEALFTDTLTIAGAAAAIRDQAITHADQDVLEGLLADLDALSDDDVRRLLETGR